MDVIGTLLVTPRSWVTFEAQVWHISWVAYHLAQSSHCVETRFEAACPHPTTYRQSPIERPHAEPGDDLRCKGAVAELGRIQRSTTQKARHPPRPSVVWPSFLSRLHESARGYLPGTGLNRCLGPGGAVTLSG